MKRSLVSLVALAALALTVAGCSRASQSDETPRPTTSSSAEVSAIVGRWQPVVLDGFVDGKPHRAAEVYLEFDADGTWTSSDGCNAPNGTWQVAPDGGFTSVSGLSLKRGCDNVDHGEVVARTTQVDIDGETLRLLDYTGGEVAVYERSLPSG